MLKKFLLLLIFVISFTGFSQKASALEDELTGWMWSSNIGWVSTNCKTTNTCTLNNANGIDYAVKIDNDLNNTSGYGLLSGYAWSSNIGWISFQPMATGCPSVSSYSSDCLPRAIYNSSTSGPDIIGWAQVVKTGEWISLSCLNGNSTNQCNTSDFKIQYSPNGNLNTPDPNGGAVTGFAWGGDIVGWLKFDSVIWNYDNSNYCAYNPTATNCKDALVISASPSSANTFQTVTLTWASPLQTTFTGSCAATSNSYTNTWTGSKTQPSNGNSWAPNPESNIEVPAPPTGTNVNRYTITCPTINGNFIAYTDVTVLDAPALVLTATPGKTVLSGDTVDINWEAKNFNPDECVGTGSLYSDWNTTTAVSTTTGSFTALTVPVDTNTNFTLTCTNTATSEYAVKTINITALPLTASLAYSGMCLQPADPVPTLNFSTNDPTPSCTVVPTIGSSFGASTSGGIQDPNFSYANTQYEVTCTNGAGVNSVTKTSYPKATVNMCTPDYGVTQLSCPALVSNNAALPKDVRYTATAELVMGTTNGFSSSVSVAGTPSVGSIAFSPTGGFSSSNPGYNNSGFNKVDATLTLTGAQYTALVGPITTLGVNVVSQVNVTTTGSTQSTTPKTLAVNFCDATSTSTAPSDFLNVSPTHLIATASGGSQLVTLDSSVAWTATSSAAWISLPISSGTTGRKQNITITVSPASVPRSGKVTFSGPTGSGLIRVVDINQAGTSGACADSIILSPDHDIISDSTTSVSSVTVTANTSWSATSNSSWLTFTPGVTYVIPTFSANTDTGERTAQITFTTSCRTTTYDITQLGTAPAIIIDPHVNPNQILDTFSGALPYTYDVISNITWSGVSSDPTWLTIPTMSAVAAGKTTFTGSISARNLGASTRSTDIIVSADSNPGIYDYSNVTQCGTSGCGTPVVDTLSVNKNSLTLISSPAGSDNTIELSTNTTWSASIPANSWLAFNAAGTQLTATVSSGANQSSALYYDANTTSSNRTPVVVTFTTTGSGTAQQETVTVDQLATGDAINLNKNTLTVPTTPAGSDASVEVSSSTTWSATIPSNTWLAFNAGGTVLTQTGSSGTNQSIALYYDANSGATRTPVDIVFRTTGSGTMKQETLTVSQLGTGNSLSVTPNTISQVPAIGATSTVTLDSTVAWTSSVPVSWISVSPSSGALGVGQSISITVDVNTGGARGPATVTFEGPLGSGLTAEVVVSQVASTGNCTISDFHPDANHISSGNSTYLHWITSNCTSVSISGIGSVIGSSQGLGELISPTNDPTVYTLTASDGINPQVSQDVTIYVSGIGPPPTDCYIDSFTPTPGTITSGSTSTLEWNTTNCTSVDIDHGIGNSLNPTGIATTFPLTTTTKYILVAQGPGGPVFAEATVTINPPVVCQIDLFTGPTNVQIGHSATLLWSTSNCTNISISPSILTSPIISSGAGITWPLLWDTTFVLSADDGVNFASMSVPINVTIGPVCTINSFYVTPSSSPTPVPVTLNWDTSSSCTDAYLDGGTLSPNTIVMPSSSGTYPITTPVAASTTYLLTASDSNGSVSLPTYFRLRPIGSAAVRPKYKPF